jgi:transposase
MVYVGIDVHRKSSQLCALDERGEVVLSRRVVNEPEAMLAALDALPAERPSVAIEACFGWEWLADLLEREGIDVHAAHPLQTRAIAAARVKTDAVDARTLAHLLRADLLPEAWVAPREVRDLRELLRQRVWLTQLRSAVKNRVHSILARQGIQRRHSDLFGVGGRAFLAGLQLAGQHRARLEQLLRLVDDFDREIRLLAGEVDELASSDPRVEVISQLPGIGRYSGLVIVAEIGDVSRFPTAAKLASYAGLVPRARNSGERTRSGGISHQGPPYLRWVLVEAAQHAARGRGPLAARYRRIERRRGRQIAKVATAHQLLTLCFYGLRDGHIRCLNARASSTWEVAAA